VRHARGIIPALVLDRIEKTTGKPVASLFDLIAGTSTGGILALGLTVPDAQGKPRYTAADLVKLYEEEGAKIFSRSIWHRLHSGRGLTDEKYPAAPIEEVLQQYFGDTLLSQALTQVIIASYEIESRTPFFFKSRRAKTEQGYDFLMRLVARATSAAPTYFPPCRIYTGGAPPYYALVDGGVFANNPAMCALAEAKAAFPPDSRFLVVSLGTGQLTRPIPYAEAQDWGLLGWAPQILNVVFDGVLDTVDYQVRQFLPDPAHGPKSYYRFQTELNMGSDDMDDASATNLFALKAKAGEILETYKYDIDTLCQQLLR
jgi:predicted acylesterase/phospholipase RssA